MIATEDERHGQVAGYLAGCRQACCRAAMVHYEKRRLYDLHRGLSRTVPALGSRRRLEALQALGWSVRAICRISGMHVRSLGRVQHTDVILRRTAEEVDRIYRQLHMRQPPTDTKEQRMSRARTIAHARRQGFAVPLAWDNIDTDPEPPQVPDTARLHADIDPVVIFRAMNGQRVKANPAERAEVIRRWQQAGRPLNDLDTLQGWNVYRDLREMAA